MAATKGKNPFATAEQAAPAAQPAATPTFPTAPIAAPAGAAPPPPGGQFNPYGMPGQPTGSALLGDDFDVDLTGVTVGSGARDYIAPGDHLAYVTSVEHTTSKAGNQMFVFDCTVAYGEYVGKTQKLHCVFAEPDGAGGWKIAKAAFKLNESLIALGLIDPENATSKKPSVGTIKTAPVNRCLIMEMVEAAPYQGRPQADFARMRSVSEWGLDTGVEMSKVTPPS